MPHQRLTLQARALFEALDAAIPQDLTVEGTIQTDETDDDLARIVLHSAFDRIDEVLDAISEYEQSQS